MVTDDSEYRSLSRIEETDHESTGLLIVFLVLLVLGVGTVVVLLWFNNHRGQKYIRAKTVISTLRDALDRFVLDHGQFPAVTPESPLTDLVTVRNDFPVLWTALMDRDKPYLKLPASCRVVVREEDGFREASREDLRDPKAKKFILDPWNNPYVYRCSVRACSMGSFREQVKVELYSVGPNAIDDTASVNDRFDDIR